MSYYNFNDHFWSPKTVCGQKSVVNSEETNSKKSKIKIFFSLVCIAICTPILLNFSSKIANKTPRNTYVNVNDSNCLILTRNQGTQLYCSSTQQ